MRWTEHDTGGILHSGGLWLAIAAHALAGGACALLGCLRPWAGFLATALAAFLCGPFAHWAVAKATISHRMGEPPRGVGDVLRSAGKRWRRLLPLSAAGAGLLVPAALLLLAGDVVGRWSWALAWAYLAAALCLLGWCAAHLVYENRGPLSAARRVYALFPQARAAAGRMLAASAAYAGAMVLGLLLAPWAAIALCWALTPAWWYASAVLYARAREEGEAYRRWVLEEDGARDA